jgi:uncharacterized membrane protein YkvA (DUF1232 family)
VADSRLHVTILHVRRESVGETAPVTVLGLVASVALTLALSWGLFLLVLALVRPKGIDLRGASRLVPDIVRLVRDLARDDAVPAGMRRRLGLLLAYLAFPIDLVPDVIPVLGYADDVIIVAFVLRSALRSAGNDALERHWRGTPEGLAVVRQLTGR